MYSFTDQSHATFLKGYIPRPISLHWNMTSLRFSIWCYGIYSWIFYNGWALETHRQVGSINCFLLNIVILLNDYDGRWSWGTREHWQFNPLALYLFLLIADLLSHILYQAQDAGTICGAVTVILHTYINHLISILVLFQPQGFQFCSALVCANIRWHKTGIYTCIYKCTCMYVYIHVYMVLDWY